MDQYIENSPDFAQPVLNQIRTVVHEASAEIEEEIKWKFPTLCTKVKFFVQWFRLNNIAAWVFGCMMR